MKPVAAFHFESGPELGDGHRIRCLSLAARLADDFELVFPDVGGPADLLVVDGYGISNEWIRKQHTRASCILQLEDTPRGVYVADAILNPSHMAKPEEYPALPHTDYRLGNRYRLVRPEFLAPIPKTPREGVWFAPGGTDAAHISPTWVRWLIQHQAGTVRMALSESTNSVQISELRQIESQFPGRFSLRIGADAATLVRDMDTCRLAICTSSGVFWEALSRQLPIATGYVADNQSTVYSAACDTFGATGLGDLRNLEPEIVGRFITQAYVTNTRQPVPLESDWSSWCTSLIRVPRLRKATPDDAQLLYGWMMDPAVRQHSLHPEPFPFDHHLAWLHSRLSSSDCELFIAEWKTDPCGMIRFDRVSTTEWKLNYLIGANHRGLGLSHGLVAGGMRALRGNSVLAQVKPENIASLKVFRSAGWSEHLDAGLHHFRFTASPTS